MEISDRMIDGSWRLLVVAATVGAILGLWGGAADASVSVNARAPAFRWLHPQQRPRSWKLARLPSGHARFAYPGTWRPIRTDPGTASVALIGHGRLIRGYLNATPRQGRETLANWPSFRIEHLRDEEELEGCSPDRPRARARISLRPRLVRDRQLSDDANPLPRDCLSRRRHSHQLGDRRRSPGEDLGTARGDYRAGDRKPSNRLGAERCLRGKRASESSLSDLRSLCSFLRWPVRTPFSSGRSPPPDQSRPALRGR